MKVIRIRTGSDAVEDSFGCTLEGAAETLATHPLHLTSLWWEAEMITVSKEALKKGPRREVKFAAIIGYPSRLFETELEAVEIADGKLVLTEEEYMKAF